MHCKTCKYWTKYTCQTYYGPFAGLCCSDKFVYAKPVPINGVSCCDYDGHKADFFTGEEFGCIHYEEKTQ